MGGSEDLGSLDTSEKTPLKKIHRDFNSNYRLVIHTELLEDKVCKHKISLPIASQRVSPVQSQYRQD